MAHYNELVYSDYNIYQYIHITDKVWRLSGFFREFLYLNAGNGAMPLNLLPKFTPWVVFSVLYKFRVVCVMYKHVVFVLYFLFCMKFSFLNLFLFPLKKTKIKTGLAWCEHLTEKCVLYQCVVQTSCCIWAWYTCCIIVLYKLVCACCIFCVVFFQRRKSFDH